MRRMTCLALAVLSLVAYPQSLSAQAAKGSTKSEDNENQSTGALPLGIRFGTPASCTPIPGLTMKNVIEDYYGNWRRWKDQRDDVVRRLLTACGKGNLTYDDSHPLFITLIYKTDSYSFVMPSLPYTQSLKGVAQATAAVVLVDGALAIDSLNVTLLSTQAANPLRSQIPSFVEKVVDANLTKGFVALGVDDITAASQPAGGRPTTPPPLCTTGSCMNAFISETLDLPYKRGTITEGGKLVLKKQPGKDEAEKIDISVAYVNKPKAWLDLTATAGALTGKLRGAEKMKVDGDKYASDPLGRGTTMAALAIHPKSYDSTSPDMTPAERISFLVGGLLTPARGFGTAVNVGLIRGLSANVGWAWMWVPTAKDGGKPGDAAPLGNSQLVNRRTSGLFVGGGYAFGKD